VWIFQQWYLFYGQKTLYQECRIGRYIVKIKLISSVIELDFFHVRPAVKFPKLKLIRELGWLLVSEEQIHNW
jgi:hypothetical protein